MSDIDFSKFKYIEEDDCNNDILTISIDNNSSKINQETIKEANSTTIYSTMKFPTNFLLEKYQSPGHTEVPLRALLVGHNPSKISWERGLYYANPSNRMWFILRECQIVPSHYTCEQDDLCPKELGIGFTDLGTGYPETNSQKIPINIINQWKYSLYNRIEQHMKRSSNNLSIDFKLSYPRIIVFTGLSQWKHLFSKNDINAKHKFTFGKQLIRPNDWPDWLDKSVIFVCTSTSGAAALSNDIRIKPYQELKYLLDLIPWPFEYNKGDYINNSSTADSNVL